MTDIPPSGPLAGQRTDIWRHRLHAEGGDQYVVAALEEQLVSLLHLSARTLFIAGALHL